jgi:hypothetical protein
MKLDPRKVPPALEALIPWAENWGVGDDFEREALVRRAPLDELRELIHSIDDISDDDLFGWLGGQESYNSNPTDEYLAITSLTIAIESAKAVLRKKVR